MPLDTAALGSAIEDLFVDPPKPSDPSNVAAAKAECDSACAAAWADAMKAYASDVVPPSTTVEAAAATLEGALPAAFKGAPATMETAFAAFALTVAGGMAPTFTGVPPAGPVGFAALLAAVVTDRSAAAAAFAAKIDTWFRTGTATLVAPPNTVSTWS
jgi:hypothetical protein